jgi:hypothetical protein
VPTREQLPLVLLVVGGVVVAAALGLLVSKVRSGPPPIDGIDTIPSSAGTTARAVPAARPIEAPEPAAADDGSEPPSRGPGILPRDAVADQPVAALAESMREAVSAYDRADYEGAKGFALEVLGRDRGNVRMLRVLISSSCILGDLAMAKDYYPSLPPGDQKEISRRCARYGIEF